VAFQKVAQLRDIPSDRGLCVRVGGIDVGLFRVGDGIHAMENACPHAGDPLSEGHLAGAVIECSSHGWTFDVRTGFAPGGGDGFPIPCFSVRVDDDEAVWVDLEDPINLRRRVRSPD